MPTAWGITFLMAWEKVYHVGDTTAFHTRWCKSSWCSWWLLGEVQQNTTVRVQSWLCPGPVWNTCTSVGESQICSKAHTSGVPGHIQSPWWQKWVAWPTWSSRVEQGGRIGVSGVDGGDLFCTAQICATSWDVTDPSRSTEADVALSGLRGKVSRCP